MSFYITTLFRKCPELIEDRIEIVRSQKSETSTSGAVFNTESWWTEWTLPQGIRGVEGTELREERGKEHLGSTVKGVRLTADSFYTVARRCLS